MPTLVKIVCLRSSKQKGRETNYAILPQKKVVVKGEEKMAERHSETKANKISGEKGLEVPHVGAGNTVSAGVSRGPTTVKSTESGDKLNPRRSNKVLSFKVKSTI